MRIGGNLPNRSIMRIQIVKNIYFLQKEIFPYLFNQDLSRIKLGLHDYKKIIYLII